MTTRKIDHKQLKARGANTGDILRVAGADDLDFINPNSIVVGALTAGQNITIESNGLIVGQAGYTDEDAYANSQTWFGSVTSDEVTEGTTNLYFSDARVVDALANTYTMTVGNIIPAEHATYDLGNTTHRWRTLYVSGQTISLGNLYLKDVAGKLVITTDPANVESDTGLVDLTTDDIEEGSNLYFTNTRAIGSLTGGTGITIESNGLVVSSGEASVFTGSTDGVQEGTSNLYFTNARVYANVITLIDSLTTNDIEEGSNLYFTNTRAVGAFTAGDGITIQSNGLIVGAGTFTDSNSFANLLVWFAGIDTDDLPEGTANLYFTNARSIASLTGGDGISIEANGLIVATGNATPVFDNVETGDLTVTGNLTVQGNLTYLNVEALEVDDNMIYLNANSTTANPDLGWAGNYNDGTYQHAGVFRDASDGVFKFFDEYELEPDASSFIDTSHASFHLANVQATTFIGNLTGIVSSLANHDTDDLVEGTNLYFTNTRAVGALTGGTGITIESNGLIVSSGEASVFTGTTDDIEEGSANLYFTNTRAVTAVKDNINTSNVAEGANLYFTNTRAIGSLTGGNGIVINANGLVVSTGEASVFTGDTDGIAEGASNLYFTNTRAVQAFTGGDNITIEANGLIIGQPGYTDEDAYANSQTWFAAVDTDDIPEGTSNLYFSNVKAIEAVNLAVTKLTVSADGTSSYLFDQYTGGNPDLYVNAGETIAFDLVSGHPFRITDTGGSNYSTGLIHVDDDGTISTGGTAQGKDSGTLYWKVPFSLKGTTYEYLCGFHASMNGNIVIKDPSSAGIIATVADNLTTDNVIEGANLYFTNTRAIGSLTAGEGIELNANGLLTANLSGLSVEASNIFASDIEVSGNVIANGLIINGFEILSSTSAGDINANTLTTNVITSQEWEGLYTDNVIEGSNLYFTNTRAIGAFIPGSTIVLEANGYIDTKDVTAWLTYTGTQIFTGNGVQTAFTMNNSVAKPDTIIVTVNGLVKIPTTDYTVNGNQLEFVSAPANSAAIEVRFLNTTTSTSLEYYLRTYTGNGVQTVFTVGSNLAANSIMVFENGVAQVPYVDYSVVASSIVFVSPPGPNTTVQIRELPQVREQSTTVNIYAGSTSNISEGSNLYFTNTRAIGALTGGSGITIESNGLIVSSVDYGSLSVGDLEVSGNLTVTGNLTTISAQSLEVVDPLIKLASNNETSDAVDIGFVGHYSPDAGTTKQHAGMFRDADDGHFYVFSEYVDENLEAANIVTNIDRSNNTFKLATLHANVLVGTLFGGTSNVAEGSNLYFTNTRAVAALTGGLGIDIESNGLISANTSTAPVVTIPHAVDVFTGNGVAQSFAMSIDVYGGPESILVLQDGLTMIPTTDYTVSNTTLTFVSPPVVGSNVSVRHYSTTYGTPASSRSIVRRAMVTAILFG